MCNVLMFTNKIKKILKTRKTVFCLMYFIYLYCIEYKD
ncbi:MAG: hypothetical protein PARBB_01261 [Parabacteroides distasonis]